jgi:hypothetical protein
MIIEKLNERLLKKLSDGRNDNTDVFRCSSAGSCTRQLAYKKLGFEGEKLSARALKVFRMGDLVEQDMLDALGELILEPQKEVVVDLGEIKLSGHIDGLYKSPELNETFVIDFKSINTRGFTRAEKGEIDDKYKIQMCLYLFALGLKRAILVYYNKDTSAMCEVVITYDPTIIEQVKDKFIKVLNATKDNLPDRDYNIDDKDGWICSYCAYILECYPDRELKIEKGKPKYVVKEVKMKQICCYCNDSLANLEWNGKPYCYACLDFLKEKTEEELKEETYGGIEDEDSN